jgi:hypothetical protein
VSVGEFGADLERSIGLAIDVFVDASIVEVFAGGASITVRVDPALDTSDGVWLVAHREPARFSAVDLSA